MVSPSWHILHSASPPVFYDHCLDCRKNNGHASEYIALAINAKGVERTHHHLQRPKKSELSGLQLSTHKKFPDRVHRLFSRQKKRRKSFCDKKNAQIVFATKKCAQILFVTTNPHWSPYERVALLLIPFFFSTQWYKSSLVML